MSSTTLSSSTILKPYDGLNIPFTSEGYINATVTAAHFGKRPNDWLALPDTKAYVNQLCDFLTIDKNQLVITRRGGDTRKSGNGGTWLHRKLAVPFARWCDVRFAVWCDHQIELILSGKMPQAAIVTQPRMYFAATRIARNLEFARSAGGRAAMYEQLRAAHQQLGLSPLMPLAMFGKPADHGSDQMPLEV
jgi:hypothetical protein